MRISNTILKVFLGCCSSAFLMEILMSKCPESANLITFLQFFFISLQGFVFTLKFGTIKPKIPLKHYAILIALFFVTSVANNYVYALHVPSTLHMIIRSASSPASMLVYCIVKKQSPRVSNAIGSVLISVGVVLATYGGAPDDRNDGIFLYWCIGVAILVTTLITGAFTGLQQEILYAKYGKHPSEMMFFTHALPLPFFLAISSELVHTGWSLSWDIWLLIALNIISQFYCTHSVHKLATKETSVTVTFILTLRKFVSLLISSVVFKNNLTSLHILGTICVTIGTLIYFNFFENLKQRPVTLVNNNNNKKSN
ncbi:UDP-xylose and UDP-N-acetylglucosamine transporter-like [Ostrinia furnacalis]|uniref:UDP-xylose and UDP-N-acetylglucosamine transporter-like n=1 Tax=Ostrinia furnacalis TaxID=93504 RepID=UPI00103AC4A9|nr:UDP-xylose and UDP-N-acetylglucosamine transporter-like [Ostrinia furnacalis]